jgi:hypothetical protein
VGGCGRGGEAIGECDRMNCLDPRSLDRARGGRLVEGERLAEFGEDRLSFELAVVTPDAVVHLGEVDPTHHRSMRDNCIDATGGGLKSVEPSKDGPGAQTDAQRRSLRRSASRRAVMPLCL